MHGVDRSGSAPVSELDNEGFQHQISDEKRDNVPGLPFAVGRPNRLIANVPGLQWFASAWAGHADPSGRARRRRFVCVQPAKDAIGDVNRRSFKPCGKLQEHAALDRPKGSEVLLVAIKADRPLADHGLSHHPLELQLIHDVLDMVIDRSFRQDQDARDLAIAVSR